MTHSAQLLSGCGHVQHEPDGGGDGGDGGGGAGGGDGGDGGGGAFEPQGPLQGFSSVLGMQFLHPRFAGFPRLVTQMHWAVWPPGCGTVAAWQRTRLFPGPPATWAARAPCLRWMARHWLRVLSCPSVVVGLSGRATLTQGVTRD